MLLFTSEERPGIGMNDSVALLRGDLPERILTFGPSEKGSSNAEPHA